MINEHLEKLRAAAKARFDSASTPEEVKTATEELAHLDETEKELEELTKQNASLLASYKEVVKREPVTTKQPEESEDDEEEGMDFSEALEKVLKARQNNK